ncbi:SpoIIE family protein phosphatase [Desulforhopalus sp. IMCC35007]|uniref:SpoIIE family protein phosphatase n=1 Tax=Desulforhopalus sp. IMCC35007 TaxID=2569543 RepID=UPI0010ADEC42|nr:SpoIIE family protein phosphatase [Desulforhopalus sp. IMCC35007]TKB11332.1 HAMP domain-containing protein [Desulforhopalus sp. IMCC35007]
MMIQPRSLQQRTLLFILVPIFLLLVCMSVAGYIFVRTILLNQWGETAIAKLQRTAHQIDMRLRTPKDLLLLLHNRNGSEINRDVFSYIINEIKNLDGVVSVNVEWPKNTPENDYQRPNNVQMMGDMHFYHLEQLTVSSPQYNSQDKNRTISLESKVNNKFDKTSGRVEVVVSFDNLINDIIKASWWKTNKAYLIDDSGNVLANTSVEPNVKTDSSQQPFGSTNELERDTLKAMGKAHFGTVFGPGSPPNEISGFYRLAEAPWTMVVIAPGNKILHPVIRFKLLYILSLTIGIVFILLIIRGTTSRLTKRIKELSAAADTLANGSFGPPLAVTTHDEVGELTNSFNKMTQQLKQRLLLKEAMNVAREVQQNLLPHDIVSLKNIIAGGLILYCDETGGDYFDILRFPGNDEKVGVVVGDVVGHGIGAALLMTTVRALLRGRVVQPGNLGEVMSDVNSLLCQDTMKSGNFVTLFYLEVDRGQNTLSWVRAGHDPAIVYCPASRIFSELKGQGVALGVDETCTYEYNELPIRQEVQLILLGSDGAWEVENQAGEQYGRERMKKKLADNCTLHPDEILQAIIRDITAFRGENPQNDDITLALVKMS